MANCPRCGSPKFRYELRAAGTRSKSNYYRTGIDDSWVIPAGQKTYKSQRKQKSVGFCPNCGYIEEKQEKGCLFYLLCLLFFPISLSIWFYRTDLIPLNKKWKGLVVAVFWLLLFVCALLAPDTGMTSELDYVWKETYTDLSNFDYYIDNEGIVLKDYNGSETRVNIAPTYNVDGEDLTVVALDGTFALKSIDSVIIPETVTAIASNTFNSCGVDYLYFPSSLRDFTGWSYFHDVQKIYYGGSEEDWAVLYTGDRSRLDVVQIICNSDTYELTKN